MFVNAACDFTEKLKNILSWLSCDGELKITASTCYKAQESISKDAKKTNKKTSWRIFHHITNSTHLQKKNKNMYGVC